MDQPAASRVFSPVCELTKTPTLAGERADWICAGVILLIAAAIRIAFFSRGLGTDEIVYIAQAYRLLDGQVPHATYLGAIRYGINAFQALSIRLFGNGEAGAAGLFFACSLAGILLTYLFANYLWGRTSAIWSALAVAVLPLDVTLAGSLNPDPYLGLFIGTSLVVFYFAETGDRSGLYFLAGLLVSGMGVLDQGRGYRLWPTFRLSCALRTTLASRLALVPARRWIVGRGRSCLF